MKAFVDRTDLYLPVFHSCFSSESIYESFQQDLSTNIQAVWKLSQRMPVDRAGEIYAKVAPEVGKTPRIERFSLLTVLAVVVLRYQPFFFVCPRLTGEHTAGSKTSTRER